MKGHWIGLALCLALCFSFAAAADLGAQEIIAEGGDLIQRTENGTYNWTTGKICADGYGAPREDLANKGQRKIMAIKAAEVEARAALAKVLNKISIDSDTTVEDMVTASSVVVERMKAYLNGSYIAESGYDALDDVAEAKACLLMTKDLYEIVIPFDDIVEKNKEKLFKPPVQLKREPTPVKPEVAVSVKPETPAAVKPSVPYTGLIVDASGLGARPAMSPRLLVDPEGNEIYGPQSVDREVAMNIGFAGYASSVDRAKGLDKRLGSNPMVVKATGCSGGRKTDLLLSKDDASTLYDANLDRNFLKDCKVVMVIN